MYIEFEKWLNNILEENMPIPGAAINFNLYEEADLYWSIQLICASYFDEEDEEEMNMSRSSRSSNGPSSSAQNLALEKMYSAGKQRWDGKRYSIFHVK